jgi:WD40 repeat protein
MTALTDRWESIRGLAWSPGGDEIWFTAGSVRSNRVLRAVNLRKETRVLFEAPGSLTLWDVASDGRVLLSRDEERRAIVGVPPGSSGERDYSWLDDSGIADLSQDGRLLLGRDRFGVYLRRTDNSPPKFLELKDGFADALSPDGSWAIGTSADGKLVLMPTGVGSLRVLPSDGIASYHGVRWFPDGRHILITGAEDKGNFRAFVQDVNGGAAKPITPAGTWGLSVSPDGQTIAAIGKPPGISLWSLAGKLLGTVKNSAPEDRPIAWTGDGKALWLFRRGEVPAHVYQLDIATGQKKLWKTLVPPDTAGVYSVIEFQITPSGHSYFYSYTRLSSQLFLVHGVK